LAGDIPKRLKANAERRHEAEANAAAVRRELAELLVAGRKAGLSVSEMAALASCSRETAHKLLRERGHDEGEAGAPGNHPAD
jgi:hypothetical protein